MKRLVFITGASRGLGQAIAEAFENGGAQVVRLSSKDMDLADPMAAEKAWLSLLETQPIANFDEVVLVNNAGLVKPVVKLENLDPSELIRCMHVNATSVMVLTSRFLRATEGLRRSVVNISSGVAASPLVGWEAYSAAKAALENFSKALAVRFEMEGKSRVLNFNPGIIDTDMQADIRSSSAADFENVERFQQFKEDGDLRPAKDVAAALIKCLDSHEAPSFATVNEWV